MPWQWHQYHNHRQLQHHTGSKPQLATSPNHWEHPTGREFPCETPAGEILISTKATPHRFFTITTISQRLKPGKEKKEKYLFFMQCTCWLQKASACEKKKAWKTEKKIDGIIEWEELGDLENGSSEIRRSTCASEWASREAASRHDLRHALVFAASSDFHSRQASDATQPSVDACRCEEHGSRDSPDWERRRHHVPRPGPGSPVSYPVSKRLEARSSQVRGRLGRHHDPTVPSLWHHRQRKNGEGDGRLGIGQQEEDRCCGRQGLLWQHHFTRFGVQHSSGFELLPTHRSLWNRR